MMRINTNWKSMITVGAMLGSTLAVPVWAHGPGHGGIGRGEPPVSQPAMPRPMVPHVRGLLGQLIFPCPADCDDKARACYDAADSAALTCITGACGTEVSTAQAACEVDRGSQACRDAVTALHTCSASCLETRKTAITTCRTDLYSCRTACDGTE
jgi:hypothetical protein